MTIHDKIDLDELFDDDDDAVDDAVGPEVVRRPTRSPPPASDTEAQQVSVDALQGVLVELRDHLTRTNVWVDEVLAGLGVSRNET